MGAIMYKTQIDRFIVFRIGSRGEICYKTCFFIWKHCRRKNDRRTRIDEDDKPAAFP